MLFTSDAIPYAEGDLSTGNTDWNFADTQNKLDPIAEAQVQNMKTSSGYIVTVALENDYMNDKTDGDQDMLYDKRQVNRFVVHVEAPAGAPRANRKTYTFSRLVRF